MIAGVLFIFWELSWLTFLPFIPYEGFAQVLLGIAGIFGLCVTIYTGVLLSSMKSRPFWNTPVLPVLFMVSGCSTGAALLSMCIGVWPFPAEWLQVNLSTPLAALLTEELRHILHVADAILISLELVVLLLYVMLQFCASNETAKAHAERWVRGEWAGYFWGLMVCCGLVIPLLLQRHNVWLRICTHRPHGWLPAALHDHLELPASCHPGRAQVLHPPAPEPSGLHGLLGGRQGVLDVGHAHRRCCR